MQKRKWFLLVVVSLCASSASAMNFLLEPMVGGQFSGTTVTGTDTGAFTAPEYGGRVGLDFHGFQIGGEYLADNNMNLNIDGPNSWGASSTSATMSNTNYGAFLAAELLPSLRLIGTFFLSSEGHFVHETAGSIDKDLSLSGYGYKGELSVKVAHYLDLGVAYYYLVYNKMTDNQSGLASSPAQDYTQHAVIAQISIPLEL